MRIREICDVAFSGVTKEFLIGSFKNVIRSLLGLDPGCKKVTALRDISFEIPRGELMGVLGRNGSGKSTLLRVAAGVYHPERGTVILRRNPTAMFEMGLFGNQHLTGRQFCSVFFTFMNVPQKKQAALIEEVKDFSEIENYFEEPMKTYSSGMLARVLFTAMTSVPAGIILLDEILSVGDEHFQGKSYKRLVRMISHGASGILATHDWAAATRLCSNIIVLDKGSMDVVRSSQEATRDYLKPHIRLTRRVFFLQKEKLQKAVLPYQSGRPFEFSFEVESTIDESFSVAMALEIPRLGVVAVLSNDNMVHGGRGIYRITAQIAQFPISYYECYLSLFLVKPRRTGEIATEEIYDQISWTNGESIRLYSEDARFFEDAPESIVHRSFSWKQVS